MSSLSGQSQQWVFRIFLRANDPHHDQTLHALRKLCQVLGAAEPELVDVNQSPDRLEKENIVALPCIERLHPAPPLRIVGHTELLSLIRLLENNPPPGNP